LQDDLARQVRQCHHRIIAALTDPSHLGLGEFEPQAAGDIAKTSANALSVILRPLAS
jgi:hypothetical protein